MMRAQILPRALTVLGGAGLFVSLAMISRTALSERRARREVEARFRARAAVTGGMVALPATISVPRFFLDETEVTVAAYGSCVAGGMCTAPSDGKLCNWGKPDREDHPVNCVDWFQATAFCTWAGKRLPTLREWQLGGCGVGEGDYPWGRESPADQDCFERDDLYQGDGSGRHLASHAKGTCPVHEHAASPRGFFGMGGNVAEWTASESIEGAIGSGRPAHAGATWAARPVRSLEFRCDFEAQHAPWYRDSLIGFRCARDDVR